MKGGTSSDRRVKRSTRPRADDHERRRVMTERKDSGDPLSAAREALVAGQGGVWRSALKMARGSKLAALPRARPSGKCGSRYAAILQIFREDTATARVRDARILILQGKLQAAHLTFNPV